MPTDGSRTILYGVTRAANRTEVVVIRTFRDLIVWQKGIELAVRAYEATERFPRTEAFGLTSQIRRAAISIPSNIAEGKAVGGQRYRRHLKIALGSESELQTQVELAKRLKMINEVDADALLGRIAEVGRMLSALVKSLPKN
jgi:four helix bundle protein